MNFASTALPYASFLTLAQNSSAWADLVTDGYQEYRLLSVRISSQPINRYSVTRSVGGMGMALFSDTSTPGSFSLSDLMSNTSSRQVPVDEHWEVVWAIPQASAGVWYDTAGAVSSQLGAMAVANDAVFTAATSYCSLAYEVIVLARGQFTA
jgi:hypothetical protein